MNSFSKQNTTFWISILAIATFGLACSPSPEQSSIQPANTQNQLKTEPTAITMAVIPWQVSREQETKLQPLADYLSQQLKKPFQFQITKDYATAVELLVQGKVDLAYLGPSSYIQAKQQDPQIEPLVSSINQDTKRPWYTSVIIASKSSGIKKVQDLKGKRFAFVSKLSASGYVVPTAHFQEIGINPENDFSEVIFTGSHDKSKQALLNGKVDAIADDQRSYNQQLKEGKINPQQYIIIWESVPLPSVPITASSKVSGELKDALKKAFIEAPTGLIDPSGSAVAGYTLVQDRDYNIIRELQKRVANK